MNESCEFERISAAHGDITGSSIAIELERSARVDLKGRLLETQDSEHALGISEAHPGQKRL
jgi:hypothetical protein